MPFEENQFFMNQFLGEEAFPETAQEFEQGQVNNFVNHTTRMGERQAVEHVNYYDTYHHRINNYHTMNTNRYRDHYVDHNIYYNTTRNVYDGAYYHTVSGNVGDRGRTGSNESYSVASNEGYSTLQGQGSFRRFPGCGCRYRRQEEGRGYDRDRTREEDHRECGRERGREEEGREYGRERGREEERRGCDRDRTREEDYRRCDRDRTRECDDHRY